MSRKTRKLIWSAPLVAVLAVAGASGLVRGDWHQTAACLPTITQLPASPVMGLDAGWRMSPRFHQGDLGSPACGRWSPPWVTASTLLDDDNPDVWRFLADVSGNTSTYIRYDHGCEPQHAGRKGTESLP